MVLIKMGLAKMSPPKKLEFIRFCVTSLTGNPNFVSPIPTAATMATTANNAEAALMAAKGGGADDKANLRVKLAALDLVMRQFASYVDTIANANPTTAEAVILSAGLQVKSKGTRTVREFDIFLTGRPGEVEIRHKSVKRGVIEFQICTDLTNEANWFTFETGTRGRILKRDLLVNTRYYFRARTIDKNGRSAWSEVRSVFIME
jgi:hypothetical protein